MLSLACMLRHHVSFLTVVSQFQEAVLKVLFARL
jgi:hypothetical protein